MPQGLRRGSGRDRLRQTAGRLRRSEALRVIDAIVTCYTEAMVEHHEATKFPPVRGIPPTPDPMASPFADLEDDLPGTSRGEEAMMDFNSSKPVSGQITALVDAGMQQPTSRAAAARDYLGHRVWGTCERALQFEYAKAPGRSRARHGGRMLRIFERGHVMEDCMVAWLATQVSTCARTKPTAAVRFLRRRTVACAAHVDGVIVGGPEGFRLSRALGRTNASARSRGASWKKACSRVAKPVYAAQVAIYQAYLATARAPALFTAINADTMDIYVELVPFDARWRSA